MGEIPVKTKRLTEADPDYLSPYWREAAIYVQKTDRARQRYVKRYFSEDIDDPLLYHLVINTGRLSHEEGARLVADAILHFGG